jgi:hypothetical protein
MEKKCIIKYVLDKWGGKPYFYFNEVILFNDDLYYDDFVYNSVNLTQLYSDFLKKGDSTTFIDDFFFDVTLKEELLEIENKYEIIKESIKKTIK